MAVARLHRRQPTERAFHARTPHRRLQRRHTQAAGGIGIHHQCRIALAGGLLGTAVGVVEQAAQRAGKRQRWRGTDAQVRLHRVGDQPLRQRGIQHQWLAGGEHLAAPAQHARPGRAHRQVVAAVDRVAAAVHPHPHLGHAVAGLGQQRELQGGLGAIVQLQVTLAVGHRQRPLAFHPHPEPPGLAAEVLHVQRHRAAIARRQHPWHAGLGHHRRAHQHLGVALAVAIIRIHQRRHPQAAVEIRQRQLQPRIALRVQCHRPGEQVHRLHPRGRPPRLRQRLQRHVAAEAQPRGAAGEGLDHPPVHVPGIGGQAALGEEVRIGVGHREAGDVEDAHVHRRHRHVRLLSGQLRHAHRHRQLLLRARLRSHLEADGNPALVPAHRHVGHADRPCRGDLAGGRAAAQHQRGDVDVMALPVLRHRDAEAAGHLAFGALEFDLVHVQQAVALHQQHAAAGVRRGHRHLHGVAGAVAAAVQRQLDPVRTRIRATVVIAPAPAGAERIAHRQPGGRIEHIDPVLAPLHREIEARRAGTGIDAAGLHVLEPAGEIVVPAPVLVEPPVVVAQLAYQGHLQPLARLRLAVGIHPQQLEARIGIGVGAVFRVEQRPHPDQHRRRPQHPPQAAVHRPATAFMDAAGDGHPHRRVRLGRFLRQFQRCLHPALRIQLRVQHLARLLRQLHGGIAEHVARQLPVQWLARHRQRHLRGETVAGSRRAVQIGGLGDQ